MKVTLTTEALHDLENIRTWLTERSPQGRETVMADIRELIRSFSDGLVRGRTTPRDDVFERVTRKYGYILPYTVKGDTVYVLRVYDSRQKGIDYQVLNINI